MVFHLSHHADTTLSYFLSAPIRQIHESLTTTTKPSPQLVNVLNYFHAFWLAATWWLEAKIKTQKIIAPTSIGAASPRLITIRRLTSVALPSG
jgi:hypothetical protein